MVSSTRLRSPLLLRRLLLPATLAFCLGGGCATQKGAPLTVGAVNATATQIDGQLEEAPEVEAVIVPYRTVFQERMGEVLAICPVVMQTGRPEGLLGALVADMVLEHARGIADVPVDACVVNNGGLRIPWQPGEITVGLVYEVMPFDNEIVLLRFSAAQMQALADEIAASGGEPVSGLEFEMRDRAADRVRVNGEPLLVKDYWVATNDYLAGGGGRLATLWEPQETRQTGLLIREAIAQALRGYAEDGRPGKIPIPELGRITHAR